MRVIVAPDSFKGSLSSYEVCKAIEKGISSVDKKIEIEKIPLADGGEGTVQALVTATGGRFVQKKVIGPLGEPVMAEYGILGDDKTAVIEMAAASGLPLVPLEERNPLITTTFGTGELIKDALLKQCTKLIIGIGGSATTDCGTGMAQALGIKFYTTDGRLLRGYMNGEWMGWVGRIEMDSMSVDVKRCDIRVACDVDNPLLGEQGAVWVYSRQKGAKNEQLPKLESHMRHIINTIEHTISRSVRYTPGAGAAGGLGAGLMAFTDAKLNKGIDIVLKACHFSERIKNAQLIITGEGKLDAQTTYGKTIKGLLVEARKQSIPVIALSGRIEEQAEKLYEHGLTSMFSICPGPISLDEALHDSPILIQKATERLMRLILTIRR
jgi:glycerate kinase